MNKLTKIVATLGPASDSEETIKLLIEKGANVFRFNTKHGTPEWHEERIKLVQKVATDMGTSVGVLLDLQGPEIRLETRNAEDISLEANEEVVLSHNFDNDEVNMIVGYESVINDFKIGDSFLIDDGSIHLQVTDTNEGIVRLTSTKPVVVKHRKGVNLPGKNIDAPSLITADLKQLDMAALNTVDYVALSFVRNKADVQALRDEMNQRNVHAEIVIKVENQQAIDNIDELIEATDAVMVARGDLGVEVPIEKLAYLQRMLIDKAKTAHKPVITATEMLHSMVSKPRPTRAEATDVSNAVFMGTDAVMLSAESAQGEYPVESVEMMSKIAAFTESVKTFELQRKKAEDKTQLVAMAALEMVLSKDIPVDKIVVFTQSGYTARVISSFRPNVPIIAVTDSQKTVERLTLCYGVTGYMYEFPTGKFTLPENIIDDLGKNGVINKGETILVVHGARWKEPGLTNSISLVKH